jgi:hypothetical protein
VGFRDGFLSCLPRILSKWDEYCHTKVVLKLCLRGIPTSVRGEGAYCDAGLHSALPVGSARSTDCGLARVQRG